MMEVWSPWSKIYLDLFGRSGNEEFNFSVRVSNPIFESSGRFLAVGEDGGNRIYLISGRNIVWQKELEGEIDNITVNRNGYVAVALSDSSYRKVIEFFDPSGTEVFRTFLATSSVIDMDISEDNRYLAVAEINLSGIIVQSSVRVISIENVRRNPSEGVILNHTSNLGSLIMGVSYNSRNNLVVKYDSYIKVMMNNYEEREVLNFQGRENLFVDIGMTSLVVLVREVSEEGNAVRSELRIINTNDPTRVNSRKTSRNTKKYSYLWKYCRDKFRDRSTICKQFRKSY